jgi:hypothetical protein
LEAIFFDIDGTLADIGHRLHFIKDGKKDWDSFFNAIPYDTPITPIMDLAIGLLASKKTIFFVTGRPENTRNMTISWLTKSGLNADFNSRLFMRKSKDYRQDAIIKKEILEKIRKLGFEPTLIFDDRKSVVEMWREQGFLVAQVSKGDY